MNRRVLINLIFFSAVFVLMLFWAVNNIVTIEAIERPYDIAGEFDGAFGIGPDAEVAYLGVSYGRVSKVERIAGGVRIDMKIDRDQRIPEDSTAHIFRKSAVGEPYIDLAPPEGYEGDEGPFLEKGAVIPQERTTVPLQFSELLRSASRVISGVSPERTRTLLHELAVALNGRADALRRLTVAGDQLAATFASRTELLDRLATNNTRLTRVVTEHRSSLGQSLTNLREVAAGLRAASEDTTVLLDRGSELMTRTADLVDASKGNLDCLLHDLEDVIDLSTSDRQLGNLRTLLRDAPPAFAGVFDSRDVEDDGVVWIRVNLLFEPENPPPQYVPPRELPDVPDIEPCQSPLQPSGTQSDAGSAAP
ncbi:MAG: MCE family protein, partial [Actinomycetota bacterium]